MLLTAIHDGNLTLLSQTLPKLPAPYGDEWGHGALQLDAHSPLIALEEFWEKTQDRQTVLNMIDLFVQAQFPLWCCSTDIDVKDSSFPHLELIKKYESVAFQDPDQYHRGAFGFYLIMSDLSGSQMGELWEHVQSNLVDDLQWNLLNMAAHPYTHEILFDLESWKERMDFLLQQGFSLHQANANGEMSIDFVKNTIDGLWHNDDAWDVLEWAKQAEAFYDQKILDQQTPHIASSVKIKRI